MKPPHCKKSECPEHDKEEPECIDCRWRGQRLELSRIKRLERFVIRSGHGGNMEEITYKYFVAEGETVAPVIAAANTSQAQRLEELEELISTDLSIKELHVVPGRMDLSATHPLAAAVTASLVSVFKSAGAENYFEMEAYREDVGPIVITIQRREGKTPGRIAQELRDELKRLKESV